jgi:hypothetical protein
MSVFPRSFEDNARCTIQRRYGHVDATMTNGRRHSPAIVTRLQRLERAHGELHTTLEGDRQLGILIANLMSAGHPAPVIGATIEWFAQSMRAPIPRERLGGLARASHAWRYLNGTFMPESERYEARRQGYERYAVGGRARAASALRAKDGVFSSGTRKP